MNVVDENPPSQKDTIERQIAESAAGAFAKARIRALGAKLSILVSDDGNFIRISPSGQRDIVGAVEQPKKKMAFKFKKDTAIAIRWAPRQD